MYPILFSIGKFNIYSHGLMLALGAIVGGLVTYFLAKKEKFPTNFLADLLLWSMLGGILGAKILYILVYPNLFTSIFSGGFISFGGAAGGLLVASIFLKSKKQSVWQWFDLSVIGLAFGWAIGRVGCFLNGDVLGIASTSKIAILGRLPLPLFESVALLVISLICWMLYRFSKVKTILGLNFSIGIGLYGLIRFFTDFLKDEPTWFWQLKYGQIGSILVLFFAIILIISIFKKIRERTI